MRHILIRHKEGHRGRREAQSAQSEYIAAKEMLSGHRHGLRGGDGRHLSGLGGRLTINGLFISHL